MLARHIRDTLLPPTTTLASLLLLVLAAAPLAESRYRYLGCFSGPTALDHDGGHRFLSVGLCEQRCAARGIRCSPPSVYGLTNGTDCFCGDAAPPWDRLVEGGFCDRPCAGYARDMCGGIGFFSIYFQEQAARPSETSSSQQRAEPMATREAAVRESVLRVQAMGGSVP